MFNYYKSGFQKAKPHNLKLILLSLITFVICYITSNIAFSLVILRAQRLPMLAQLGESTVKSKRQGQSMIYSIDDIHVSTLLKQAIHHSKHPSEGGISNDKS